ncbi:MAG: hypothetical protein HDQ88_11120 [Clostridia bacterium]|nr:hypothetical protein [Clostridia bacterium]
MNNPIVNLIHVILGFLILGFCWGFEGNTVSGVGCIVSVALCVAGMYVTHRIGVAIDTRKVKRTLRVTTYGRRDRAA